MALDGCHLTPDMDLTIFMVRLGGEEGGQGEVAFNVSRI